MAYGGTRGEQGAEGREAQSKQGEAMRIGCVMRGTERVYAVLGLGFIAYLTPGVLRSASDMRVWSEQATQILALEQVISAISLRSRYAVSGTDMVYLPTLALRATAVRVA
eukprot:664235-Rhodomonas_salina.4